MDSAGCDCVVRGVQHLPVKPLGLDSGRPVSDWARRWSLHPWCVGTDMLGLMAPLPRNSCDEYAEARMNMASTPKRSTLWNTRVFDDNVRHLCDTCFDKGKSECCLVKAPAMHASESVLVVGELLCTGVQANTERHTRNETREMCSCWGYKQHSSSRNSREWRDSNFQQSSRLANLGS